MQQGCTESAQVVAQIAGASEEQIAAGQHVVNAINTTAAQAKLVAKATAEQTTGVQSILGSVISIKRLSQQVSHARNVRHRLP